MKKLIVIFTMLMTMLPMFGQSYKRLWEQVKEASEKDLPKTQYEILQKIAGKAAREKAYGQLLKAELLSAQTMMDISPDSLRPEVERIAARSRKADDAVLQTVYQTVLYRVYAQNRSLEGSAPKPVLTDELCARLAAVKDDSYAPFVVSGSDSKLFANDMLSVIGFELNAYKAMYDYYNKVGNRQAACLTAWNAWQESHDYAAAPTEKAKAFDTLIARYGDLPEAGELAIARYNQLQSQMTLPNKVDYLNKAIARWGNWKRISILKNRLQELTNPSFSLEYPTSVNLPMTPLDIRLYNLRNVSSLTLKVSLLKADGDISINVNDDKDFASIKSQLTQKEVLTKTFDGHKNYEYFEDDIRLKGLPAGLYLLEFTTSPATETVRALYYVTGLYVMAESLPKGSSRYAVVDAVSGKPIAGAKLRIKTYTGYNKYEVHKAETNAQGEYVFKTENSPRTEVFAYTDGDRACPPLNSANRYRYYANTKRTEHTCVFTDRAIYRPGQTVHAAAMIYEVNKGYEHQAVAGRKVTLTLRDANWKELKSIEGETDAYGMCTADFTLPTQALTGNFTILANGQRHTVRVEEYKRPSFEVTFDAYRQNYKAGDTVVVKGKARSYSGVPVQGAAVKYKVERRYAFWWWSYWRYYDGGFYGSGQSGSQIAGGEAVTGDDGTFEVAIPMVLPESTSPQFYNFVVTADVTDGAGETHQGQYALPLGNRPTALSIDLAEQVLAESEPVMTLHLRNAAGQSVEGTVKYRIDKGPWQSVASNQPCRLPALASGSHELEAQCGDEKAKRTFVVFSLDDKRPATETHDWFYRSAAEFPADGKPVTIQVGSSDPDMHIFYSVFSADSLLEQGTATLSNALINRKFTYQEAYGDGISVTFAWVKDGQCHTHVAKIRRPLPDKRLRLQWNTFRDRLTPGQQEEWTLTVLTPDGKPADAMLMATMYDRSLDQLQRHQWAFTPYVSLSLPDAYWSVLNSHSRAFSGIRQWQWLDEPSLSYSHFDRNVFPVRYTRYFSSNRAMTKGGRSGEPMLEAEPMMLMKSARVEESAVFDSAPVAGSMADKAEGKLVSTMEEDAEEQLMPQLRENLDETAFFYPRLTTDSEGRVVLKFTLPESLTTWHFMGLAHTRDMCYGLLDAEAVAQKELMIQPNMPRFVREGDQSVLSARIFNNSGRAVSGKAVLRLKDPVTDALVAERTVPFSAESQASAYVSFTLDTLSARQYPLLVCQVMAVGDGFSDGEQHYLPLLPATERVTVSVPYTQVGPGTKTIDLAALVPGDASNARLTFEYTNNPVWLTIQALPYVGTPADDNVISQAAAYYANSVGQYILSRQPKAKTVFQMWKREEQQGGASLLSALEQNAELKDVVLAETPWVMDADSETEQKHRLADFFDDNTMTHRLASSLQKMGDLQGGDGGWSWWPGMPGSFYMTVTVAEMLVRLNALTGAKSETSEMLSRAFGFMGREVVREVEEMKRWEKEGHKATFPSFKMLQWLYLCALDGRQLPAEVQKANAWLMPLLKKDIKNQSIYDKAMTAVILSKSERRRAREYVKSLKEYTVYREEMGRYYDTPRAGYSWFDYRIPTQTMAIEAIQRVMPGERQTVIEMQRWLLQSKRTQAWDTPINSVNAIYTFLNGGDTTLSPIAVGQTALSVDGQPLDMTQATAAIGYEKTARDYQGEKSFTAEKTSEGISWGAVYAQFMQPVASISQSAAGISVKRELIGDASKVGNKVKVRITIDTDRDLDFVQVIDRRAACLEPASPLSGYRNGAYCTPKDASTNYYFHQMAKGRHTVETEYYIDRAGTYLSGTCTVQCAYAPEFRATAGAMEIKSK